ncbi:hypothetical protein GLOTRDRAFT_93390 [Gloeophyllum trabeum ATCC 11539]|uniref:Uncharacterized protein n=1 Tax=Gloeophyllum trabeum (strain ATCC 11539 / FP-39264 / Madison 617) TaxID=670483 RepID=S7Q8J5_GLOTA|nr:uncharacterized protein GLOTRDRAFT_93390 [Gloeophyllum trabeum ATCC 11539]EPQ55847.1 hypothetical protein GLOTRDRAFT_93390 [Gloeophyllum trabeum ATCC 11539]
MGSRHWGYDDEQENDYERERDEVDEDDDRNGDDMEREEEMESDADDYVEDWARNVPPVFMVLLLNRRDGPRGRSPSRRGPNERGVGAPAIRPVSGKPKEPKTDKNKDKNEDKDKDKKVARPSRDDNSEKDGKKN